MNQTSSQQGSSSNPMAPGESLHLVVWHPVPSLNKLFAMTQWQRCKEKKATQLAFRSALRAIVGGFSTPIIWRAGVSTSLIAADTPSSSQTTVPRTSSSILAKRKCGEEKMNELKSTSKG